MKIFREQGLFWRTFTSRYFTAITFCIFWNFLFQLYPCTARLLLRRTFYHNILFWYILTIHTIYKQYTLYRLCTLYTLYTLYRLYTVFMLYRLYTQYTLYSQHIVWIIHLFFIGDCCYDYRRSLFSCVENNPR